MKNIIFALTGAGGGILAKRALAFLAGSGISTHIVFSDNGENVYNYETGANLRRGFPNPGLTAANAEPEENLRKDLSQWMIAGADFSVYGNGDLFAPIASGSFPADGMIIMPCSMTTAAKIATGTGGSLLCRAASVCIKEKTPLVIVPRESPLSSIHLQNLLTLSQNGVFIMPPVPAFYDRREEFDGVIDGIVGRVLKTAGIENNLYDKWKG